MTSIRYWQHALNAILCVCALLLPASQSAAATSAEPSDKSAAEIANYRQWIEGMKTRSRGPFKRLRWFCSDGSIQPPRSYACAERGGGRQHGQWSDNTERLRERGYLIANVLAAVDAEHLASHYSPLGELQAIILEQFLIDADDGWILRKARFYRGAFQAEAEQRQAANIMRALTQAGRPVDEQYLLILEAAKRLPSASADSQLLNKIRSAASSIHRDDPSFGNLRNKIHGRLGIEDSERVRAFAQAHPGSSRHADMLSLADNIDLLFTSAGAQAVLQAISAIDADMARLAQQWQQTDSEYQRFIYLGQILRAMREHIEQQTKARPWRFAKVAELEQAVFASGRMLIQHELDAMSRRELLGLLSATQDMLYGVGLLTRPEWQQVHTQLHAALGRDTTLADYQQLLRQLARVPTWSERRAQFFFQEQSKRFAEIEPLAAHFVPDRLRGSPLLIYTTLLKKLNDDAASLSGIQHAYFDKQSSTGFRVLNPGVARGVLHTPESLAALKHAPENVILVVPETLADLPPVTGLLTAFEGNQLSHVQLLARNLGIPNIVVSQDILAQLDQYQGRELEVLASAGGVVRMRLTEPNRAADALSNTSPQYADDTAAADSADSGVLIRVDPSKLDLSQTLALSTKELSAASSGVTVGPKAAKVAELSRQFPGHVSPGLAIPFGSFRQLLDNNPHPSGPSMFEWIRASYAQMEALTGAQKTAFRDRFLHELREWFLTVELDPIFVADLRQKMQAEFGADGSYGVFVRSDTNVEDLPGFTGAGLNLTLAHVVGFDNILAALRKVWASPFTERAFGWRQARMDKPEHVYTAILLHKSVPSDTSGVLVTTDVFDGKLNQLSVVLNEGVAGGVEGLSAETLRIDRNSAAVERIASATAPYKRVLLAQGGSAWRPASSKASQLSAQNIQDLIRFSANVGQWFSDAPDAIADVEFGFYQNQFILFQIRPLVDSPIGRVDPRLRELDAALQRHIGKRVDLSLPPQRL